MRMPLVEYIIKLTTVRYGICTISGGAGGAGDGDEKQVLGEEHPESLMIMANLVLTYWSQGQWKEAEELEVLVMETRKWVLGEEHPDLLLSMFNLALMYWNQDQ